MDESRKNNHLERIGQSRVGIWIVTDMEIESKTRITFNVKVLM
jgi:hypothetical protein